MRKDEKVERIFEMVDHLKAPVEAGKTVGSIRYVVDGVTWRKDLIVTEQTVEKIDFSWCLGQVLKIFVSL